MQEFQCHFLIKIPFSLELNNANAVGGVLILI